MHVKQGNPNIIINQKFIGTTKRNQISDVKQILSTKLSIEDYNTFLSDQD